MLDKVSRETLERYLEILLKWNKSINLISSKDSKDVFQRHILDSAQLLPYITDTKSFIADLGSGAGLPGAVLSIMGCKNIHLIEQDERKCVFLREVKRQLKLDYEVINKDIKFIDNRYDVCVSRGLGNLETLLSYSQQLLNKDGYCLFLKGKKVDEEIAQAEQKFMFNYKKHSSITDQNGIILEIRNIKFMPNEKHYY